MHQQRLIISVLLAVCWLLLGAAPSEGGRPALLAKGTLADARFDGGLCASGAPCETSYRVLSNHRVLRDDAVVERISAKRYLALQRAIARIDLAEIHRHAFHGTCPSAYDGQEVIYRFRGIATALRSCRWDLTGVEAVRLMNQVIAQARG